MLHTCQSVPARVTPLFTPSPLTSALPLQPARLGMRRKVTALADGVVYSRDDGRVIAPGVVKVSRGLARDDRPHQQPGSRGVHVKGIMTADS